jgi:hypothetical protein
MAPGDSDDDRTGSRLENARVVDFNPDNNDWEDEEDAQLAGLGTTTLTSRHRNCHSIPARKHQGVVKHGVNSRATAEKKRTVAGHWAKALAADIKLWETGHEELVHSLAEKHRMKVKEVRRRMLASTTFKPHHRVSPYNAKISRIMADLNEGKLAFWTAVSGVS